MNEIIRSFFVFILLMRYSLIEGLTCLSCYGITHPRFCDSVTTCQDGEVCALQRYLDPSGYVTYNVGCVVNSICHQKRSDPHAVRTCVECCNQDMCNDQGCGENGHGNFSGHYCYSCKGFLENDVCQHVTVCNENEACSIQEESRFGERFFSSGCRDKQVCPAEINSHPILGKRSLPNLCNKCCTSDLCNKDCKEDTTVTAKYQGPIGTTFYVAKSPLDATFLIYSDIAQNASCDLIGPEDSVIETIPLQDYRTDNELKSNQTMIKLHCNTQIYLQVIKNFNTTKAYGYFFVFPSNTCAPLTCISETESMYFSYFNTDNPNLNSVPFMLMANYKTRNDRYFILPIFQTENGLKTHELRIYSEDSCNIYAYDSILNLVSFNQTTDNHNVSEIKMKNDNIASISTSCFATLHMVFFSGSFPVGMTVIPGINQYISYYYHKSDRNETLSIIIPSIHTAKLLLDGSPVVADEIKEIQTNFGLNDKYALLKVNVQQGFHKIYTTGDISFALWYYENDNPPMTIGFKIKI